MLETPNGTEHSDKPGPIDKPIFVIGCCNSGTTILWEALKEHNDLCGPKVEGQDLERLPDSMKHFLGKATFRLWAHPKFKMAYYKTEKDCSEQDRAMIEEVYSQYLEPGKRFITKSPADTMRARMIQGYFPDAYFVGIVRNGYAVSEGIVRKRWDDPERPQFKGMFTSIDEAAEQWFRANTIMVSHKDFLKRYKIIKYEDLVESPHQTLRSVLDFCGLDASGFPVQPDFTQRLNEKQMSRLKDYEIETVTKICQPMLIHFGYAVLNPEIRLPFQH